MRNTGLKGLHQMIGDLGFKVYFPHKCKSKTPLVIQLREAIKNSKEMLLIKETTPKDHVDYVILANIDRFGRDVKNMISLKNQLEPHKTSIISVCQSIKTGSDIGEMRFAREAMEAEMFSRDKSYRIKSVKSAKRLLGNFMGGRPQYGRKVTKVNGVRVQVEDSGEKKIVDRILTLHRNGDRYSIIAGKLNKSSTKKRGQLWTSQSVLSAIRASRNKIAPMPIKDDIEDDDDDEEEDEVIESDDDDDSNDGDYVDEEDETAAKIKSLDITRV
jgi:DNA invertase Pin-like site-specific DNA recombinase